MPFGRLVLPKRWWQSTKLYSIILQKTATFNQVEIMRIIIAVIGTDYVLAQERNITWASLKDDTEKFRSISY
jgi:hypothetical protein